MAHHVDHRGYGHADYHHGDLQHVAGHLRHQDQRYAANGDAGATVNAARAARGHAAGLEFLRQPAGEQHRHRGCGPWQGGDEAGIVRGVVQALHQEGREPGDQQREAPIGAEAGGEDGEAGRVENQFRIRNRRQCLASVGGLHHQGAFLAPDPPGRHPDQPDHAEHAEGAVPVIFLDNPFHKRNGNDDADRCTLRNEGAGQGAQMVGEPFIGGVQGDRIGRAFARPERDAAGQQRGEADGAEHGELG